MSCSQNSDVSFHIRDFNVRVIGRLVSIYYSKIYWNFSKISADYTRNYAVTFSNSHNSSRSVRYLCKVVASTCYKMRDFNG